ncbi:hypothetical protein D3C87_1730830 [compost metagenome]
MQGEVRRVAVFGKTIGHGIELRFAVPVIVEAGQGIILPGTILFKLERTGTDRRIVFGALFQIVFFREHMFRNRVDLNQGSSKCRADLR